MRYSSQNFRTNMRRGSKDTGVNKNSPDYQQRYRAKDESLTPCPRCGRVYKNPENAHYADFKNKIRCMERI